MADKNIFISMGTPYNPAHAKFRDSLIELLRDFGTIPRAINVTDYPTRNPLTHISNTLRQCDGAIIVAYERTFVDTGLEKRKSPDEKPISAARYTTPWNQIEAAMAHALGLPILVLVESGLKEEGLLEDRYEWYVERVEISPKALANKTVQNRIRAWCQEIQAGKKTKVSAGPIDPNTMSISDLLSLMTVRTGMYLVVATIFIFSIGMAAYPVVSQVRAKLGF